MEDLRAVYCNWLEKNATKLIVDAEKEGYQKLVSSDLFGLHKNFSNSYTGYWRALTARFLIPHLIKSLYEIEHPAWLDRLYDAPISATPVTVDLAYRSLNERFSKNAENTQKEHDSFDGCLLECVRIILDAIVLDAKAMGSLIPIIFVRTSETAEV